MHNLITERHRIVVQGSTKGERGWLVTADYLEVDETQEGLQENLDRLNAEHDVKGWSLGSGAFGGMSN